MRPSMSQSPHRTCNEFPIIKSNWFLSSDWAYRRYFYYLLSKCLVQNINLQCIFSSSHLCFFWKQQFYTWTLPFSTGRFQATICSWLLSQFTFLPGENSWSSNHLGQSSVSFMIEDIIPHLSFAFLRCSYLRARDLEMGQFVWLPHLHNQPITFFSKLPYAPLSAGQHLFFWSYFAIGLALIHGELFLTWFHQRIHFFSVYWNR